MNYVVIDIGTNSVIMLAFTMDIIGNIHVVFEGALEPRLGENLFNTGEIGKNSIERTINAIEELFKNINWFNVDKVIAIGTHALRIASNSNDFKEQLLSRVGCELNILSSENEAKYSFFGGSIGLNVANNTLVADVGGGSTEISYIVNDNIFAQSMRLGAVELSNQLELSHRVSAEKLDEMKSIIDNRISKFILPTEKLEIIASGGTATSIAMIDGKFSDFDISKIHGYKIQISNLKNIVKTLAESDNEQVRSLMFFAPSRADIILSGIVIYLQIMIRFGVQTMTVSQKGLRWGIAYKIQDFL